MNRMVNRDAQPAPAAADHPRRAGMTLLEVILAITALAAISTLVTALWALTNDWTNENAAHHKALRLEQTLELLSEQWESRILTLSLSEKREEAVLLDDASLVFVTSAPILHHDWPLVRVTYTIVRTGGAAVGEEPTFQLHYIEEVVKNPATATADPGAYESFTRRELSLLDGFSELRWEQYVDESGAASKSTARGSAKQPVGWAQVDQTARVASIVDKKKQKSQDNPSPQPATSAAADSAGSLRAGRLVGVHQGEPFAWQFIAEHSR